MDRHLNLFYTYNRDPEFIENNLTRAFIVALRVLGDSARQELLKQLLREPLARVDQSQLVDTLNLAKAQFALQNHMDKSQASRCQHRYVLAIATDAVEDIIGESYDKGDRQHYEGSIPDAWIFNAKEHCFLVEAKIGSNPLGDKQIRNHAIGWLKLPEDELDSHILSVSWVDVVEAAYQTLQQLTTLNDQERYVLDALITYLSYFRYRRRFAGFDLASLSVPPSFRLTERVPFGLNLTGLDAPPGFRLSGS
jgi:hypothetical protein